jgi:hypothetical protein
MARNASDVSLVDDALPFRAANTSLARELGPQRIPRRIHQTGQTLAAALRTHGRYMQGWWRLNPEYDYRFYDDATADRYVAHHGTAPEQAAYRTVRTGAQKADLFRLIVLRYSGGIYADADTELRRALRGVVPRNRSGVVGKFWSSEAMAFEPNHPLLVRALRTIVGNVHRQVKWIRQANSSAHCASPHSCVLLVSGPFALRDALVKAAAGLGCSLRGAIPAATPVHQQPSPSCPDAVRDTHVCTSDRGSIYRTWICGAAYHWDCRNSGATRRCSGHHYSKYRGAHRFFNVSAWGVPVRGERNENGSASPRSSRTRSWHATHGHHAKVAS